MKFVCWEDVAPVLSQGGGGWEIYALVDPRDETVRYVGVTSAGLEKRLRRHLLKPSNGGLRRWFSELAGTPPSIRLLDEGTKGWARAERYWIAWFRARGDLYNVDPGGICRGKDGKLRGGIRKMAKALLARARRAAGGGYRPTRSRKISNAASLSPEAVAAIASTLTPPKLIKGRVGERATRTWGRDESRRPVVSADVRLAEERRERLEGEREVLRALERANTPPRPSKSARRKKARMERRARREERKARARQVTMVPVEYIKRRGPSFVSPEERAERWWADRERKT